MADRTHEYLGGATADEIYGRDGGAASIIVRVADAARPPGPLDMETSAGRNEAKSRAYAVSQCKSVLLDMGKAHTEAAQAVVRRGQAARKQIEEALDALRDEIRAPLTAYEKREEGRVAALEARLAAIVNMTMFDGQPTVAEVEKRFEALRGARTQNEPWDEYESRAVEAMERADKMLATLRGAALWAEQEAQREAEAEAQRNREIAAEQARRMEAERDEQARREEAARALRERKEAEDRVRAAEAAAQEADRRAKAAAAEAERRQKEAEERHARQLAEAEAAAKSREIAAEKARLAEVERQKAEDQRRADDKAHRTRIFGEIGKDIMDAVPGISEAMVRDFLRAAATGKIRNLNIVF